MTRPLVHELQARLSPIDVFRRLSPLPHCLFFDSAEAGGQRGRYSYLMADPREWLVSHQGDAGIEGLTALLPDSPVQPLANLPPFQGGVAGVLSYELCRELERVPAARFNEFGGEVLHAGLYDVVVAFDHHDSRSWIISTGKGSGAATAGERLDWMLSLLSQPPQPPQPLRHEIESPLDILAPQYPVSGLEGVSSDFSREQYLAAVRRAVELVHAGDVFQVNLSQRLLARQRMPAHELYLQLRQQNPAPFAGYADLGDRQVCSASPERFLSVRDGQVETRPIKGTRPRSADTIRDTELAVELQGSEKDRAENVMIVDLLRNDLSRVATPESLRVPVLCGLESYRHVHHLVSVVTGQLAAGRSAIDLLRAAFPGGSITGAPKVRAMQIIAELEPTARGPYCGAQFWCGFNGQMDSSILIRTAVCGGGWVQASVGGGVVADSDPASEYEETLHKARGLVEALNPLR